VFDHHLVTVRFVSDRDRESEADDGPIEARDPLDVLGLTAEATTADIVAARRRLAKSMHPDRGGSLARMQQVNAAAADALTQVAAPSGAADRPDTTEATRSTGDRERGVRHDHPSFTIEVLPAVAHEALIVASGSFGEVIDDDPPYVLEVAMIDPIRCWCRLDVVPDAGASTVSLAVAGEPGLPPPDVTAVRDLWVAELNSLVWSDPADVGGHPRRPPS
jgi:hypothetical protein